MNPYRIRIWQQFETLLDSLDLVRSALDFGAGDGWFASQMSQKIANLHLDAVDIKSRGNTVHEVQIYDGQRLPFDDRRFDLVYSVDVLHHCPAPKVQMADALRTCNRYFLLKDHTYSTPLGKITLCALDELGNRRFGVPSLYRYQYRWEWFKVLEKEGFQLRHFIHPAPCHSGVLGKATNSLQFIALWEREAR